MTEWIKACDLEDIETEDVFRFDYGEATFAIYRTDKDEIYCTDGICTHRNVHLAEGLVMGCIIECPKHNGRFDCRTGEAKRKPARHPLKTYSVKVEQGQIYIFIGSTIEAHA